MLLTIDAGNSCITIGCTDDAAVVFQERISTNLKKTDLEYAVDVMNALRLHNVDAAQISGSIISCVVAPLKNVLRATVKRLFSMEPFIVSAAAQHLLSVKIDRPQELGPAMITTAIAAVLSYGAPAIIINMGTATTISVVNEQREFIGGAILPGMQSALDALTGGTAQLPRISLEQPVTVLGKNTVDSLTGGAIYGNAGMIDALITRMIQEAGFTKEPVIAATGGPSETLIPFLKHKAVINEDLSIKGLAAIYRAEKEGKTL